MKFVWVLLILMGSSAFAGDLLCPTLDMTSSSDVKPSLIVSTHGFHALVCGIHDPKKEKDTYNGFDAYSEKDGKFSRLLSTGELQTFLIQKEKDSIALTEMIYFRGQYLPAIKKYIQCNSRSCSLTRGKCSFKLPAPFKTDVLEKIKPYITGAKKEEYLDDSFISDLEALALTGNRTAISFYEKNPGFKLDEHSTEEFDATRELLARLKKSGCPL